MRLWNPGDSRILPEADDSCYPPNAQPLKPPRPARSADELIAALVALERRMGVKPPPEPLDTRPPELWIDLLHDAVGGDW